MIHRLVAICIISAIAACAPVPSKEAPGPSVRKAPVETKGTAPKHKTAVSPEQAQRQDRKYAFDLFDDTPIEILPDEILIVGRIKLSPLLQPEEQEFQQEKLKALQGKAIMVRSLIKEPLPVVDDLPSATTFEVTLDKDFLLTLPHNHIALLGGYVYIRDEDGAVSAVMLPGGWQLGIRPEDHAIYIGTIHYVRSEYDTILDYIVEDNYPQAYEAYQHRLAEGIILRKEVVRWGAEHKLGL